MTELRDAVYVDGVRLPIGRALEATTDEAHIMLHDGVVADRDQASS